ncbi:hypothetical protein ACFV98_35615 [Streptomyces violascens]|uniref:hypothetical protein n=1 Tax=Streptomyces violascens TaxID=67381 RepID=UPI0036512C65
MRPPTARRLIAPEQPERLRGEPHDLRIDQMPSCGLSSRAYDGNWNTISHSSFSTKNSASS